MLPLLRARLQYLCIQVVTACCSVLRCVALCYSVLQWVAVCCSVLQCGAVCCSTCAYMHPSRLGIEHLDGFGKMFSQIRRGAFQNPSRCSISKREGCMYAQVLQHTTPQVATCSILQHTAINGNTVPRCSRVHTATRYTTPQHTATHCDTLHHTAPYCTTLQLIATHCNTLHHTATQCNTLHHNATNCNTLHHTSPYCTTLQYTAIHCNTLQHSISTVSGNPSRQEVL